MSGPDPVTGFDPNDYEMVIIRASLVQPYTDARPLAASRFGAVLILDRIFRLLVRMIDSLQKIAATQANRLTFLTNWQKAYTEEMNQIHAFVQQNGDDGGGADSVSDPASDAATKARDDLNRTNSSWTELVRGNRTTVSDEAKGLQSNVNASNDAVNQQGTMATSIIEQMSTILGAIYR